MKLVALTVAAALAAALVVAGCGGGSGSTSTGGSTTKQPEANPGGAAKKATAPNAPAGSKVVSCSEGEGGSGRPPRHRGRLRDRPGDDAALAER